MRPDCAEWLTLRRCASCNVIIWTGKGRNRDEYATIIAEGAVRLIVERCPLLCFFMNLNSLPTPALILDLARTRNNAARMSSKVANTGAALRPHIKTHKCIEVGRLQTQGHSGAITVSTLAEARFF